MISTEEEEDKNGAMGGDDNDDFEKCSWFFAVGFASGVSNDLLDIIQCWKKIHEQMDPFQWANRNATIF